MNAARPTHPLRNALRLDPEAGVFLGMAVWARGQGDRFLMRHYGRRAVRRARAVCHHFADLPPAA